MDTEASAAADSASRPSRTKQIGADIAAGARAAAPRAFLAASATGEWLTRIGWGRFFLLALLLLIVSNIVNELLFDGRPAIVVDTREPSERVRVVVSAGPEGVRIGPPTAPGAPPAPLPEAAPKRPQAPATDPLPSPSAADAPPEGDARVRINNDGVSIVAREDGKLVELKIDGRGVRVTRHDPAAGSSSTRPDQPAVIIDNAAIQNPARAGAAVEAVREQVEALVNEQIDRQVSRAPRVFREDSSDWLVMLTLTLILSGGIAKIALGSKKKAEVRAQVASANAAEEGLKRQLAEAQLKMMQAQVEPHFLFNTLASVDYLIETDPARASMMQKNLIQYLRAALPQMREGSTTLGKELMLVRAYLEILKVRMDDRLQFAVTVPQGLMSAQFPPMMLQSLAENAIKHALEPKAEGGSITITADIANGHLRVTVADTGLGFGAGTRPGTGVGLANIRARLVQLYGGRAKFTIEANSPTGTIATIEVPYEIDLAPSTPAAAPAAPVG